MGEIDPELDAADRKLFAVETQLAAVEQRAELAEQRERELKQERAEADLLAAQLQQRLDVALADNAAMIRRFRDWRHRAYSDEDGVFIDDVEAEMRELQAQEHPGDKLLDERHKLKALEWAARQALGDEWVDNMLEAAAGKQPVGAPTDSPIPARRDESTD